MIKQLVENRYENWGPPEDYASIVIARGEDEFEVTAPFWIADEAEEVERDRSGAVVHPGFGATVELGDATNAAGEIVPLTDEETERLYLVATDMVNG